MITAEIITIGDEITSGLVLDTNSNWLAEKLSNYGFLVKSLLSIRDDRDSIKSTIKNSKADLIITTGGLGPTKDDITKKVLADFFNDQLVQNKKALSHITAFFSRRGREMNDMHRSQALLPSKSIYVPNNHGTAPGMFFQGKNQHLLSLPGVPHEMQGIFNDFALELILEHVKPDTTVNKIIRTIGIGESAIAPQLESFEDGLPGHVKLAYLPSLGQVRLRLTGRGNDKMTIHKEIDDLSKSLIKTLKNHVYATEDLEIETVVKDLLDSKKHTISAAESCTGGLLSHKLSYQPGSSSIFKGSIIAYDNEIKINLLKVPESTLISKGAVSEETVIAMAESVRNLQNTTFALATSGIAGPGGGTEDKPVGTIWIACAGPKSTRTKLLRLTSSRKFNIEVTANMALDLLRRSILEIE